MKRLSTVPNYSLDISNGKIETFVNDALSYFVVAIYKEDSLKFIACIQVFLITLKWHLSISKQFMKHLVLSDE